MLNAASREDEAFDVTQPRPVGLAAMMIGHNHMRILK